MLTNLDMISDPNYNMVSPLKPREICGGWQVIGLNKQMSDLTYNGLLTIKLKDNVIRCIWEFGHSESNFDDQTYTGLGILHGRILACNFKLISQDTQPPFEGVALYRIVTPDIMRGSWTSTGTKMICTEEARKIRN